MSALDDARAVLAAWESPHGLRAIQARDALAALVAECEVYLAALQRIDKEAGRLDEDDADAIWRIVYRALHYADKADGAL